MKKFLSTLILAALFVSIASAEVSAPRFKITESDEEFDILCILTDDMKVAKTKSDYELPVHTAFSVKRNGKKGEIRYTLLTDCGGNKKDLKSQFVSTMIMCADTITGYDIPMEYFSPFKDSDVKAEFDGDFGYSVTIPSPKSKYAKGYKYITIEFFYKENQGMVIRAFLFNDIAFTGANDDGTINTDSAMFANYHTFKFVQKDGNGNYVYNWW